MKSKLFISGIALLSALNSANAAGIYDNNIAALNINMLTDAFMSYTNYGAKMSDLFAPHRVIYGTMDRLDEYGDDGSTIETYFSQNNTRHSDYFIDNVWVNANHINESMHYGNNMSKHGRFNLATVGATTKSFDLKYGNIAFGGFASYINTKMPGVRSNGDMVGIFAKYKYTMFDATALANIGSLNNNASKSDFNNSWVNIATDFGATLKIDETFLVRPDVYIAYNFVSSDDLYVNGATVSSDDYHFFNVAPGITFTKEICQNWYGAFSAKYVAHFGGKNDIEIDNEKISGLYIDNHSDVGIDVEHNFEQFVFGAHVHKQIGGIDGWSTNINVKYNF